MRKTLLLIAVLVLLASCVSLPDLPTAESKNIKVIYHPDLAAGKVLVASYLADWTIGRQVQGLENETMDRLIAEGWEDVYACIEPITLPGIFTEGTFRVSIYRDP